MFYKACRCGGVAAAKAKLMDWAVSNFGPSWQLVAEVKSLNDGSTETIYRPVFETSGPVGVSESSSEIEKAHTFIETNDPPLAQLESRRFR